ncbi:hypothetical protein EYC80_009342 [Monilinia laxa]|uniref:Ran-binding-domain-containing protein n=1 Tax=Monilinia laxa TaxID=61186 RepID=A0A5N6JXI2_MONLA|nr:hypothetical protein EYC80_009342 [Monilinia laxa]
MDLFLGKVTQHAMNYAIRSGIGITASFAIRQTSRLLKTVDDNGDYRELHELQDRLDSKIKIVSPAIDMIELISARGNTTLESAVTLTKALRWDIQSLGMRLAKAASAEELSRRNKNRAKTRAAHEAEIRAIVRDIKKLLARIEDAVPLINLAITTSGTSLSTTLPATVSPSRLLQASNLLTAGDTQYSMNPNVSVQVGPTLTLSLYMLFAGHAYRAHDEEGMRETTWKEVIHKARVKLLRVPLRSTYGSPGQLHHVQEAKDYLTGKDSSLIAGEGNMTEYSYQLEIIEDFDDDRVHSYEDGEPQPGPYGDVKLAGIREVLPIHQISKIFYADTGKILNIGNQDETNSPVLLLKRDINALPPRRMMEGQETQNEWYDESEDIPSEGIRVSEEDEPKQEDEEGDEYDIDAQLRRESMAPESPSKEISESPPETNTTWRLPQNLDPEWLALEQSSHLTIPDELLTFFLHESSSTGAGRDASERKRTRMMARQKVGFDPYDESPVKRHGEQYQYGQEADGYDENGRPDSTYSREGTPWDPRARDHYENAPPSSPRWARERARSSTPQRSSPAPPSFEPDIRPSRELSSPPPSSPVSPYISRSRRQQQQQHLHHHQPLSLQSKPPSKKGPLDRIYRERGDASPNSKASPLSRGGSMSEGMRGKVEE